MGYMRHHAILVTALDREHATSAWQQASALHLDATPLAETPVNGYVSFAIMPDGSKEGWGPSTTGDNRRDTFINWLCEHLANWCHWAEVQYGDDDGDQCVTRASNTAEYPNEE